jgi:hypothetical protein
MPQLRVDTAALEAVAASWGTSASELTQTSAPAGLGLSSQPSAAAVNAAHADVAIFTADLAARVDMRAQHVTDANTHYIAHDAHSTNELATLTHSPPVV